MATVFTHPVIALALSPWFRDVRNNKKIILLGVFLSVFPDFDVISFKLGIPYGDMFGHRGLTHSLAFSALVSAFITWFGCRLLNKSSTQTWLYLFLCMASHGILDALTNGGHGVAFFAPFTDERYFYTITPIQVSTLNIKLFFNGQAIPVLKSEFLWIWIPSGIVFISGCYYLKRKAMG